MSFDQPPGSKEAEEYRRAQDDFHLRLGYCIAKWAEVENELFRIFWTVLRSSKEQSATVYYYVRTLDQRLTLTNELTLRVLPKTKSGKQPHNDLKLWDTIRKDCLALLPIRNRLAHHPVEGVVLEYVIEGTLPGDFDTFGITSWFHSHVSEAEGLRGRPDDPPALDVQHLADHLELTTALAKKLEQFWRDTLPTHVEALPPPSHPYRSG